MDDRIKGLIEWRSRVMAAYLISIIAQSKDDGRDMLASAMTSFPKVIDQQLGDFVWDLRNETEGVLAPSDD